MKTINKKILLLLIAVLGFSCKKALDLTPEDSVSKNVFFSDQNDFDLALTGLYSGLRSTDTKEITGTYGGNLYWEVASDAMFFSFSWHTPWYDISRGNMSPNTSGIGFVWSKGYSSINLANTIIEQLELKKDLLDPKFAKDVLGEAHFIRAICYLRLTSLYGAVPMVDRILTPSESKLSRSSVEEVTRKLIIPDLDIAIQNLTEYPFDMKWGKATKQAAMGMKVRALLYIKDYPGTIKAAEDLMAFANQSFVRFEPDYERIFANDNENNGEILFSIKYVGGGTKQGGTYSTPFGPNHLPGLSLDGINGSWQSSAISADFIDSYYMKDGLPPDQSPLYDADKKWDNRGVRFEKTFYIGGKSIVNGSLFEPWMVGSLEQGAYKTAYPFNINKGYMNEKIKLDWTNEDESDFIVLRYTDVLLMYAEAKTEINQIDNSVYEILNKVRTRAGIASVPTGRSQNQMREIIRQERKFEFAFEGIRYFDIRRWGIAESVINSIKSDELYNLGSKKLFLPSNYLWPVPQAALDANPNLKPNNPGY
ncbi:RagB/SusD family nutrient uptake outer membrane protein [Pedobacter endophyticus]|uniref:RagB/SusD family nutrient uptake outer membrane protein n=1 Tax=Pedobacter endophyticus TaxID=2789740 RepID=A0A7U3Q501_9SPHI|nr:RagB/SusD family nutrient uptake outer membrane protein [Pedobacter endophyticus]QPH37852.1 RagB/SusD family nutrient uptake outer membrane protein [Pedobacter endophyticus]